MLGSHAESAMAYFQSPLPSVAASQPEQGADGDTMQKPSMDFRDRSPTAAQRFADMITTRGSLPTKETKSQFNDVIFDFRRAHGLTDSDFVENTPRYQEVVRRYCRITDELPDASAIFLLSTPDVYLNRIRHVGRMRASEGPVPEPYLSRLCDEIQAAFTWKSRAVALPG